MNIGTGMNAMKLFVMILVIAPSLASGMQQTEHPFPTQQWATSTFEQEGLSRTHIDALIANIEQGVYGNTDQVLVIKNGAVVFNKKFKRDYKQISKGKSNAIGCGYESCSDASLLNEYNYLNPQWHPYYQGRQVHTLQSVTKSITSTVLGAAVHNGDLKGITEPLLPFFQNYDLSNVDNRLQNATLEDLLTMRLGIEWHEMDRPLNNTNTTLQLEKSDDWVQFTLNQPMDAAPGEKWSYNSGASHMMSAIIKSATGSYIDEYANEHLFKPLGIKDYHWKKTPRDFPDTEGGLFLEAEDVAKIGYLMLQDGVWDEKRILPEGWVKQAIARHTDRTIAGRGYGYQWWRVDQGDTEVWAGLGFGNQHLVIIPEHNIVGVITSWNVFGERVKSTLNDFVGALIKSNE